MNKEPLDRHYGCIIAGNHALRSNLLLSNKFFFCCWVLSLTVRVKHIAQRFVHTVNLSI